MTRDEARAWAIERAAEIVKREAGELCFSAREFDLNGIEANSTLLAAAIAAAMIEAYDEGQRAETASL